MRDERRYQEDEVAEIFEAATAPAAPATPSVSRAGTGSAQGLTLADLKAIGREVGIAPERIAEAAAALERGHAPIARRTDFGMPVSVGRTIELPRALTDREWALLVADLRETFSARGTESSHGETRQWSNGNLHAFVEPTVTGYRLRLGTRKGGAVAANRLGAGGIVAGLVLLLAPLLAGAPAGDFASTLLMGGMSVGAVAYNALRLPRWARERDEQMAYIAKRTHALLGAGPDPEAD